MFRDVSFDEYLCPIGPRHKEASFENDKKT